MLHCTLADSFAQRPTHQLLSSSKQICREDIHSQFISVALCQLLCNLFTELQMAWVRNRQQSDLIRRETKRKSSITMFNIHTQKSLQLRVIYSVQPHRAINRSMD